MPSQVLAATRTWTGLGATSNWSLAANWSGAAVPVAADTVVFDATSVKDVTIDVNVTVASVTVGAGYTGTLTQSAGRTVTVGAAGWSQAGGTFAGGTASITVNGPFTLSAGSFTSTTGTLTVTGNLTHSGGALVATGGTVALSTSAATIDVPGSDTFRNLTIVSGTKTIAAGDSLIATGLTTLTSGTLNGTGTLEAQGDLTAASTFALGTATLRIDGSGPQTFTGTATTTVGNLPLLVIDKPAGTLTLAGTIRTTTAWTYVGGTLDPGTSTVVFGGGTITGSHTLNAIDLRATTSIAAGTTLTAAGSLSLTAGSLNGTGTLAAQGSLSQALGYGGGTATLRIDGAGPQTFTGAASTASGNLPPLVISKPAGILSLAGTIRTANNWTYVGGTIDPGASTVVFAGGTVTGSHTLGNLELRATTSIAAGTALTATGLTTLTAGSLNGTGTLAAQGSVNQALGYGGGTATLRINGTAAQTLTGASTIASGNLPVLVIDKPAGSLTLAGTIRTTNNWTYTAGTLDPGASTVVFGGGTVTAAGMSFHDVTANGGTTTLGAAMTVGHDMTVSAGTFTTSGANHGLTIGGNLTVGTTFRENGSTVTIAGNLTNNGTIVPGTSTLILNGLAGQTIGGSVATPAFNLVIDDALGVSLSANLTVTGTLTLATG